MNKLRIINALIYAGCQCGAGMLSMLQVGARRHSRMSALGDSTRKAIIELPHKPSPINRFRLALGMRANEQSRCQIQAAENKGVPFRIDYKELNAPRTLASQRCLVTPPFSSFVTPAYITKMFLTRFESDDTLCMFLKSFKFGDEQMQDYEKKDRATFLSIIAAILLVGRTSSDRAADRAVNDADALLTLAEAKAGYFPEGERKASLIPQYTDFQDTQGTQSAETIQQPDFCGNPSERV